MTLHELEEKLTDLKLKADERDRYLHKLEEAQKEFNELKTKVDELRVNLEKEQKDVKKLESFTLSNVWFSLIGAKSEKLNKEKDEEYRASMEYERYLNQLEPLKYELEDLNRYLRNFSEVQREIEDLLKEKEVLIISEGHTLAEPLIQINRELFQIEHRLKELREAVSAGKSLMHSFNQVINSLKSAKNWGTWDIFGGGLFADLSKHQHLEEANAAIKQLEYQANRFKRELKDVSVDIQINISISKSLKFFDFFFDGLFADIAVQNRIDESYNMARHDADQVKRLVGKLESEILKLEDLKKTKRHEKEQLLKNSLE